jgi:hypothetical protein
VLTISKPLSAGQAHRYHQEEFGNARENYYSNADAIRGEWHGQLARHWRLIGVVDAEPFQRLAEGQDPHTDESVVRHRVVGTYTNDRGQAVTPMAHRAGWDATFSAPKSVSITALVGGDARVRLAHTESVTVALDALEYYVQARRGDDAPEATDQLARGPHRGAEAAEIAARQTREAKVHLSHEAMQQRHQEVARRFGDQPAHLVREAQTRAPRLDPAEAGISARVAVTFAKDRNLERDAVVDERTLLRDALNRAMGEQTVHAITTEFERRVEAGEFIGVPQRSGTRSRAFTTQEMINLEREAIQMMQAGRQICPPLSSGNESDFASRHPHLNLGQRAAVEQVMASRDRILSLEGVAGAGKTTALAAIRDGAERAGYRVEGLAPTSRAVQMLVDAGIQARTLQHHLASREESHDVPPRFYVLDESSLASTRQMHEFLQRREADDRVLLVGDTRQHRAVDAGRPFEQLQEAGMVTVRLDTIVRQRDPALKAVVEQLARGHTAAAIHQLQAQGRVYEIAAPQERLQAIAREYLRHPDGTLIVSPDNHSRAEINDVIHRARQATGQVARVEHRVRVLVPRQDLTGADRQWATRYQPGDVVRDTKGSATHGLGAGEYARVAHIDADRNLVTVRRSHGNRITTTRAVCRG